MLSERAPESCTCTVFREVFSKCFQDVLEAQSRICKDETTKMSHRKGVRQSKDSIFDNHLAQMVLIRSPENPFCLHV